MPTPISRSIVERIKDYSESSPSKTCLIHGHLKLNYAELNNHIMATAYWLNQKGVSPRDVVGVRYRDSIYMIVSILGVMMVGGVPLILMPTFTNDQESSFLHSANASWLLSESLPAKSLNVRGLELPNPLQLPLDEFNAAQASLLNDITIVVTGSGSTGVPRLLPVAHKTLLKRMIIACSLWKLAESDRVMVLSPLYFFAPTQRILTALWAGATGILGDSITQTPSNIKKFSPNILHLSVFHAEKILSLRENSDHSSFRDIRVVSIGASQVSNNLRQRMLSLLGAKVHVHYGSNETFTISYAFPDDVMHTEGTVGRPPQGVTVEIVDEHGEIVSCGKVGEIRVNSQAQITGYFDNYDSESFVDRWFYPGDLGKYTEDGQLIHCGRSDQMMLMNGINIYPAEIEKVLVGHPGVESAVALALNHPVAQDIPVAGVVLKHGANLSPDDILEFCRSLLGVKSPKLVFLLNQIPIDEQGKIRRVEIRNSIIRLMQKLRDEKSVKN